MLAMMVALAMGQVEHKDVVELAKTEKVAALSTDYKGTPFGSLMPYALDDDGNPIIYISTMATHTKNLKKNEASSVMVSRVKDDDLFNSQRVTFVGKMKEVPKEDVEKVSKVFFGRFKEAEKFSAFHDFKFYRLEIEKIYYIGGFGDIRWVDPKEYREAVRAK